VGLKLDYPEGATPLDADESAGLMASHVTTQGQLNEWEQQNILEGERWAFSRRNLNPLSLRFSQDLHKHMFGRTWKWAGQFRATEKNIGVDPLLIGVKLTDLFRDVEAQLAHRPDPFDELAAHFHHRLVSIHPFANGNGRFSRTMTDLLLKSQGKEAFSWGGGDLNAGEIRHQYISALRAADAHDLGPLFAFVRSGEKVV
jgi:Fic-DOC domain mobile mystery protein B